MSRGTEYLQLVTGKLNTRIQDLSGVIQEVQKDIEGMNDYYWENYTEMDQYGYEDFDNRRALLNQISANEHNLELLQRLKKMKDAPFFGSVEFLYDGDDELGCTEDIAYRAETPCKNEHDDTIEQLTAAL